MALNQWLQFIINYILNLNTLKNGQPEETQRRSRHRRPAQKAIAIRAARGFALPADLHEERLPELYPRNQSARQPGSQIPPAQGSCRHLFPSFGQAKCAHLTAILSENNEFRDGHWNPIQPAKHGQAASRVEHSFQNQVQPIPQSFEEQRQKHSRSLRQSRSERGPFQIH